jgi:uncharacterized coiled-coil protein SlyX
MCECEQRNRGADIRRAASWKVAGLAAIVIGLALPAMSAQGSSQGLLLEQVRNLNEAMARAQTQLEQSQRQLDEIRKQMAALERELAQTEPGATPTPAPSASPAAAPSSAESASLEAIREGQEVEESQIATHEQTKVESASKYPVKVTGMLLFNGFVNTGAVDMASTPTVAFPGSGSTGATMRPTILGVDANGPRLFGARSYADLRVDFNGSVAGNSANSYAGFYSTNTGLLRLRTAHAGLQWEHTDAYFSLDRPIVSPDTPTSLTAVAEPALAWSGNLWTWNPQLGVRTEFGSRGPFGGLVEAALVDVGDPPQTPQMSSLPTLPSAAEQSRWPGVEGRVALLGSERDEERSHLGLGGYFAPHHSSLGKDFDSWAATVDARAFLPARLELMGSGYRGAALGGLGGGGYKDFAYRSDPDTGGYYLRPLDDVGGWAQLKERFNERFEMNAALGMDNVFAGELRRFAVPGGTVYQNLARNRSATGNFIYRPSAYLLFSVEYRRLESFPLLSAPARSDVIGLGAGYRF